MVIGLAAAETRSGRRDVPDRSRLTSHGPDWRECRALVRSIGARAWRCALRSGSAAGQGAAAGSAVAMGCRCAQKLVQPASTGRLRPVMFIARSEDRK